MMGLAPQLGRETAHHVVQHAADVSLSEHIGLPEALARERTVTDRLDGAAIDRLTDPANYLGSAEAFVDRVLAAARRLA